MQASEGGDWEGQIYSIHQQLDRAKCPLSLVSAVDMTYKLRNVTLPGTRCQRLLATTVVCCMCLLMCDIVLQRISQSPVVAADGHTYEEGFIREYIKQHGTSLATQCVMDHNILNPNLSVKQCLQHLQRQLQTLEAELDFLSAV